MKYTVKMLDNNNYNALMCGDTRCVIHPHLVEVEAMNELEARVKAEKMFPAEHYNGFAEKAEADTRGWWEYGWR